MSRAKKQMTFIRQVLNSKLKREMNLFAQILNPITGGNEWEIRDTDYDYHQEVARAAFGDMLHDKERNKKFFTAIRKTISKLHDEGKKAHVLDIGTGTGILSMMSVAAGADSVTACEAFMPMANCARDLIQMNGLSGKIHLIKKRSTEIVIGEDMCKRANVLVAELLDTELIGEGAINIYNHAHQTLLTDDCICIPSAARCYAQVVESPLAMQWNRMKLLASLDEEVLLKPPSEILECKGEAELHDIQMNQLPIHQLRMITDPFPIFDFDFSSKTPIQSHRKAELTIESIREGRTDMILFWWEIKMDPDGEILSCAPFWTHPDFKKLSETHNSDIPIQNITPWRDHWMQAIYHIPKPVMINKRNEKFIVSANHDEYSFWFDAWAITEDQRNDKVCPRHSCTCNLHMAYSRNRIGQMNQNQRNKIYLRYLEETINEKSHMLLLGDGCLLGLAASKFKAASVLCFEQNRYSRQLMESYVKFNNLKNVKIVSSLEDLKSENLQSVTHLFAEPYFITSILPWDNLRFGTLLQKLCYHLPKNVHIAPHSCKIFAIPVEFLDLHKIRAPINVCEGFNLTLFDQMVDISSSSADTNVEAQPLWEYPCKPLANKHEILSVKFENFGQNLKTSGAIPIEKSGECNGIALWVDWNIDGKPNSKSIVSTGPIRPIVLGEFIEWDMFVRQGVNIISKPKQLKKNISSVRWETNFQPAKGALKFYFSLEETLNKNGK